jgi:Ca-activated chloride channel family protein
LRIPWRVLAAAAAVAGGGATLVQAQIARFSAQASMVLLSATALDKSGRPVTDLKREEVRILEDGRPQKIEHFAQAHDSPLRILFLADASGSMSAALKTTSTRMALVQLLSALGPKDQAALAAFDHKYWGVVQFTTDRKKIEQAYAEIEPYSSTALHDALDKAAHDLASHGEGRRAVIVLTDGIDTASSKTADEVIARSRALDVPIYAMTVVSPIDDPGSERYSGNREADSTKGALVLNRYAEMSGGRAFTVSDFRALKLASDRIVGELKHQYRLGYDPPAGPPGFRRIAVQSTRKGVVIKTRSGYVPQS